ncbi:phosphodiester glycosidase family protein [Candidatus Gottesmanbacteria bacterium]|nr:phosphodiester glycosidase family protein [Candidatus Gottesmanbacteria bacterium]
MKKIIIALVLINIALYTWLFHDTSTGAAQWQYVKTPGPTPGNPQWKTVTVNDRSYAYDFFRVPRTSTLELIPNFATRLPSKSIAFQYNCTYAINAGFYDKAYKSLGLFVTDKKIFGATIASALLNGFFEVDDNNRADIQQTQNSATHITLQSGPLLMLNGKPLLLKIKNDEFARRSIAAISKNGDILFFSLFLPDSEISGPLLQNLPDVLMEINKNQKLNISDALNLDGGSASFFKGKELYLEELTTVGGVFCVR